MPTPRFLTIGRVAAPWGLHGEVKVEVWTEFPERFERTASVYLDETPYRVERSHLHRGRAVLKLAGVETIGDADRLRGKLVEVPVEAAVPLPPGHYYHYQIVGLLVVTTAGEPLGRIAEILATGANDVYVVRGGRREVLVPAIRDVVKEIDLDAGRVVVEPLPGMLGAGMLGE
ncbi:MAG: 16S rRNA processing protein RimM [Chloroflexi bacterium]|nr:16S rRNA processing protein RimM [Chloroflexota bacterium]